MRQQRVKAKERFRLIATCFKCHLAPTGKSHVITEFARAKVNLTLHIKGRRKDGYHLLESLVVFPDIADTLTFEPAQDLSLVVRGARASELEALDAKDNLIIRAAQRLQAAYGVDKGAHIVLEKELPTASGIGGGSADAAAAIRGLVRLWSLRADDRELWEIAAGLGADVSVCLGGRSAVMSGIGDIVKPVPALPSFWLVLVNCGRAVPTRAVFQNLNLSELGEAPRHIPGEFNSSSSLIRFLVSARNDLQGPAITLEPEIKACLDALSACDGVTVARMSGSGATCFGVFQSEGEARRAQTALTSRHPDWWVQAAKVG